MSFLITLYQYKETFQMIHQYAISIENISLSDCKKIKAIISQDRQIKAERYYKTDDKIRCLLGEAIIKYALKKDYNMNSNISWTFNTLVNHY